MAFDYVITTRQLQGNAFSNNAGPVRFIKVPRTMKAYDARHVIAKAGTWVSEVQGLADGDLNPNSISPTGDVLVFVHGYNNDIPTILERMRQLRTDLCAEGWRGEIVSFDWPSGNTTLGYIEDRTKAAKVASQLVDPCIRLLMVNQKVGCTTNVHVLGHSTGAYVIMEAFAQAEKQGDLFKNDWRIGQVTFIAGDVSRDSLGLGVEWSRPMYKRIMRLTNYSNGFDAVLAVSNAKRLGVEPRAGRVGLPDPTDQKAINLDCSDYFQTLKPTGPADISWTHSWYFGNRVFTRDLAMTLEGAIDRNAIPTRGLGARGLFLQESKRPAFQAAINIKAEVNGIVLGSAR